MNAVWERIIQLLQAMEAGFFYVFAVLAVPALLHAAPSKKKYLRAALIGSLLFFVFWRSVVLWDNPVGRYFIFPALFGCALLPCGIDWCSGIIGKLPGLNRIGMRRAAVLLTAVCVVVIGIKVGRAGGKVRDFVPALAGLIPQNAVLYGNAADTMRIAAIADARGVKDDDIEQLIFRMSAAPVPSGGSYLLVAVPRAVDHNEFADRFRWFFGIFPFDFAGGGFYRSEAYYLWKYNGKAGDGSGLDGLPELTLTGKFPEFALPGLDVLPSGCSVELRSPQFSYFYGGALYFTRPPETLPVDWQCQLIVRNRRLWPVAAVPFRLAADGGGSAVSGSGSRRVILPRLLPANDSFPAAPPDRTPTLGLPEPPEKTVIFEDVHTADFALADHLNLPEITTVTLEFGAMGDFSDQTPDGWIEKVSGTLTADDRVGLVIFNLGLHEIYTRHADLAFTPEKWRAGITALAAAAAKKYPNAKLLVAVPPAPAPGPWRFMPNGNAARAVLAYRRYAELAAGLYPDNTLIFTPGDTPDERRMFADGIYESPFALTIKGKSAFAAAVMEALK